MCTSNIMNNPDIPRWKVRRAAAGTAKLCGVAFFQEIQETEDHIDIRRAMGKKWSWIGDDIAIPIAFKHKLWKVLEFGHELVHHGKAHTSPDRYINWAVLARRNRVRRGASGRRKVICFMNTHFVSGAWNDKPKLNKEWRKLMWEVHWHRMSERIATFLMRGITVVFGGDFNRKHVQPFARGQRWLVEHGIDKLGVIEAHLGSKVRKINAGTKDVSKVRDHKATWARISIGREAA